MKKTSLFLLFFAFFLSLSAQNFKTVGYLPTYRFSWINDIEFKRLTHVNIAFANPVDSTGTLSTAGVNITNAVQKAKQSACQVFICIGGGALTAQQEADWDYLALPANRPAFIQKIVAYVQNNGLVGVDVDLEWQYVKTWYSPFILDLKAALSPLGYKLTAALPGSYRYPLVSNAALNAFDWINMMVYDLKGRWANNPGQHSPYDWAEDCIAYWLNQNVPSNKLTLGVPFYGYDFGQSPVPSYTYRTIVTQNTDNAWVDQADSIYYNGIPTIKAKTALALGQVSGVMIWEIGQDAFGAIMQFSLLKAIDEVIHPLSDVDEYNLNTSTLQVFPNPASTHINLRGLSAVQGARLLMYDLLGNEQASFFITDGQPIQAFDIGNMPSGLYLLTLEKDGQMIQRIKIMVQS